MSNVTCSPWMLVTLLLLFNTYIIFAFFNSEHYLSLIITDVVGQCKKWEGCLCCKIFSWLSYLSYGSNNVRKTMHQMGRNTKLLDWWINHSICSLLKVNRVTLVNLISLITATSLFIHFLPFAFWVIKFFHQNIIF